KKPEGVSFVDAAGCIGDAVKAYTALHYLGRMTGGDSVLIMDGASSFGSLCVQLAYHWGAKVIATASSEDEKLYLEGLDDQLSLVIDLSKKWINNNGGKCENGNNELIYSACMEESGGLGVDIIIDSGVSMFLDEEDKKTANDNYLYPVPSKHEVISALAVGGRWITSKENLQISKFPPSINETNILMDIMEKVADGIIVPNIHHTVPFDSVTDAMKCLSEIRVGKVVMKME
ncbi:quinone oxidoreductase-like protein 1, partial [Centruroides sculpturatus]|uniref:quinone oxidoreductase-like protein 1 n=1 Tax=Centruroides sculpturatus TaxID=218467 RepID=UPI000C6CCD07